MYLEVAIIDYLNVDGKLTNFNITPKDLNSHVIVESLSNAQRLRRSPNFSVGGTMIYNSDQCQIRKIETQLRTFTQTSSSNIVRFQFNHKNLPLGPSNRGNGGLWNFLLPPRWRLRDLKVVDPYDNSTEIMSEKREFRYSVFWDEEYDTQMIEMELRSNRGSFSFEVIGTMSLIDTDESKVHYVSSINTSFAIEKLENIRILDKGGKHMLSSQLAEKAKWLELKPNICGIGLNINEIIESINAYIIRLTERRR
ncbi:MULTISPECIES: hypothetical protein [Bacillus]|uniref:Uncharacterized protein n=1 Tax=Bacillus toyonensis TaxID=155322 RepID=A0AAP8F1R5_9BACI|nr:MULTISPECIES: hypothetical protein [Bacillus]MBK5347009.1 hypothetical protein [Bacillus sp. TH45]PEB89252.1 hypothetical protein CON81_30835 [Bacillus toyonensis]PHE09244.1 hypothetical protein COF62_21635 [Bacillus toyonensis]